MKILPRGHVLDTHSENCMNVYVTLVGVVNMYEDTNETQFLKDWKLSSKELKAIKSIN